MLSLFKTKQIRSLCHLRKFNAKVAVENFYFHLLALEALRNDFDSIWFVKKYISQTFDCLQHTTFATADETDLFCYMAVVSNGSELCDQMLNGHPANSEYMQNIQIDMRDVKKYLIQAATNQTENKKVQKAFMKFFYGSGVDRDLYIRPTAFISNWPNRTIDERSQAITSLIFAIRARTPQSDLLKPLKAFAVREGYWMTDVVDPETGKYIGNQTKQSTFFPWLMGVFAGIYLGFATKKP